jgi:hypothetical protein
MNLYYKLNIPILKENFLSDKFRLPTCRNDDINPYLSAEKDLLGNHLDTPLANRWHIRLNDKNINDILSKELIEFLKLYNLVFSSFWVFYYKQGSPPGAIHADWGTVENGLRKTSNYAINWTVSTSDDQSLIWYKTKNNNFDDQGVPIDARITNLSVVIPIWEPTDVIEIDRCSIDGPTLVRTDIPHGGQNNGNGYRWSFSLKPLTVKESWEEIVNNLQSLIEE